jgi:hypothetical protein
MTKKGFIYQKEWSYAIVADRNYSFETQSLSSYDTRSKKYKKTTFLKENIIIDKQNIETLLDKKEFPEEEMPFLSFLKIYSFNIFIFISGFISALIFKYVLNLKINRKLKTNICCLSIKKSQSNKELLKNLYQYMYILEIKPFILALEKEVYQEKNINNIYKRIKKDVILILSKRI